MHGLGISGVITEMSSWRSHADNQWGKKAQIDLIIEREDRYIYLCEIKFSESPYVIDKAYEEHLRQVMALFKEETKTRKTLLITFVTTYGVKANIHSGIVQNEVCLDQLFG